MPKHFRWPVLTALALAGLLMGCSASLGPNAPADSGQVAGDSAPTAPAAPAAPAGDGSPSGDVLTGRVLNSVGQPMPGQPVEIFTVAEESADSCRYIVGCLYHGGEVTTTDADGYYHLSKGYDHAALHGYAYFPSGNSASPYAVSLVTTGAGSTDLHAQLSGTDATNTRQYGERLTVSVNPESWDKYERSMPTNAVIHFALTPTGGAAVDGTPLPPITADRPWTQWNSGVEIDGISLAVWSLTATMTSDAGSSALQFAGPDGSSSTTASVVFDPTNDTSLLSFR